jgi:hypothetical protein
MSNNVHPSPNELMAYNYFLIYNSLLHKKNIKINIHTCIEEIPKKDVD